MAQAAQLRDELIAANQKFMASFTTGDSTKIAACYREDGAILPPGAEMIVGHDGIAQFWGGALAMGVASAHLDTVEVTGNADGQSACEVGRYRLMTAGGDQIDHGKYVVLWQRDHAGEWQMFRDIWNTSQASA